MSEISDDSDRDDDGFYHVENSSEADFDDLVELDKTEESLDDSDDHTISDDEAGDDFEFIDMKSVSTHIQEIIVVKPEDRRTSGVMNKFEMTEYVNIRATQIAQHNNCMVDITGLSDPVLMAKRELMEGECPLTLRRHLNNKNEKSGEINSYYEYWDPADMQLAVSYPEAMR